MTPHIDHSDHLAQRYGARRGTRGLLVAAAISGLLVLTIIGWLIYRSVDEPVQAGLASWDEPVNGVLPTTVEIVRDPGVAVTCELVAVDVRQFIVGQLTLDVPAGPEERLLVPADIPLEGDAIAPELRGCSPAE
ncbi:MAG TPA: DUF4307 domain-containing protein [Jiangellaceae bacterium]